MIDNYVTGANGFIGKHLMRRLAGQNTVAIPHEEILSVKMKPHRRVFFLSSYGNMSHQVDPEEIILANTCEPLSLFCESSGVFVFVSSSSVLLPVVTQYSKWKRATEVMMLKTKTANVSIVRPFSVTGVGEQSAHLIPTLIRAAFTGETIPFAPDAVHDYVDVEDVVDGLLLAADNAKGEIYELGRGCGISNQTVLWMVEAATRRHIHTTPWQGRPYDTAEWFSKGQKPPGWVPKNTLEDSIREMVEDYERTQKASR